MGNGGWQSEAKDWIISIGIALVLAFFIRTFIVELYLVDGPSMQPTLHHGDRLVVSKFIYRLRSPERGEVIVFKFPKDESRDFVKRVIGIPGDKVEIKKGTVYLNDVPQTENYMQRDRGIIDGRVNAADWEAYFDNFPARVVPAGTVFVLGDNRYNSEDSRHRDVGFVPESLIKGKAMLVFWPLSNWQTLP